jgi:hypothetical protein
MKLKDDVACDGMLRDDIEAPKISVSKSSDANKTRLLKQSHARSSISVEPKWIVDGGIALPPSTTHRCRWVSTGTEIVRYVGSR